MQLNSHTADNPVPLESVIATVELSARPARPPNYKAESEALGKLTETLANDPRNILQRLVETALNLCDAESAGVSLLAEDGKSFYWPVVAGVWHDKVGGGTPRNFGPCGIVLDRDAVQLFRRPERYYPYLLPVTPVVEEVLLVPFYVNGKAVGTVWVVAHSPENKFDAEDQRLLISLTRIASAGFQTLQQLDELARKQNLLREREEFNRTLFESSPDCVKVLDAEGRLLRMNTRGMCLMEIDDFGKMTGQDWCSLWPEDVNERVQNAIAVVKRGGVDRFQAFCPTAKGTPKWWDVVVAPVLDASEKVISLIAVSRDITDRMNAEAALRGSELRFRMLADNITQLAWTCDQLGNVNWYNQRWLEYTGMKFEEMKGYDWSKVHHPDHIERVRARVEAANQTGEVWEDTFPLRGKDGQYRWFLSRAVPIRDEAGKIVCWFGTNTDVTDLRAAEAALQDADVRKNEFLAMLAHELRNPLAPIGNAVQILQKSADDAPTIRKTSQMLDRQVRQMVRMVDDLLDVSRITRGKIELRKEQVELSTIVHSAVEATRPNFERMGHELQVALPAEPIVLDADPARMAQVIGNLLNNACKFTPRNGRIRLSAERDEGNVVIRLIDNGIGIEKEQLPRIFELFAQVDTSLERSRDGLGIGLTLVKNLLEMHGGTVEVFSEGVGKGCEFVIRMPVVTNAILPHQPESISTSTQSTVRRRVLIVDDNRDVAETLEMLIKMSGHDVETAHDGQQAVEAATRFAPHVVLMDIGLPTLNGYEAARQIRKNQKSAIKLIALTGWGQDEDRLASKEAGFDAHLVKPVDFDMLSSLLSE